jgi:prolyl-tRNA editing enzyme YbaK/EbsC (Cys-tRNA(Pro) deacylase)
MSPEIGTLSWQPAALHDSLLGPTVAAHIKAQELPCFVAPIDAELADTTAFCAAYQVPLSVSANCVVVEGRRGELRTMAACLVLATDRADVNKTVRKHLDVRKISFADMDTAVSETGMENGGITPLVLPIQWPILIDSAVAAGEWLVIGSGIRASKIAIRGSDLAALPGAQTLALAQAR